MTLQDKRILVTGGSRGIGAAVVAKLRDEGARVALHYGRDREAAERVAGPGGNGVVLVQGDLMDPDAPERIVAGAVEGLGGLDAVVNNAGAWLGSPIEDAEGWDVGWAANLTLNLRSAADLCRLAILRFREQGGGVIVNMTSRSAHRGDDAEHLAYGAAKGGLLSLTKGIARGYGRDGVLAYAVAPGWVSTELAAGAVSSEQLRGLPLGEVTPPQDVAEVVAFLASGVARHLTGATLDVTGADYVR